MDNFLISHPYLVETMDHYYGLTQKSPGQKNKIRILLATYLRYPHVGGVSNYLTTLKAGLMELGHQVDIVSPKQIVQNKEVKKEIDNQIQNYMKQFLIKRYGHINQKILDELIKLGIFEAKLNTLNLEDYDILHSHDRRAAVILGKINQIYHKPHFFTPHQLGVHRIEDIEKDSIEEAFFRRLDLAAIESARKVILVCDMFRTPFTELGANPHPFITIHTGTDFKALEQVKQDDRVTITCVARLEPNKGVHYLLEALSLIKNDLDLVDVLIAGDGSQMAELIEQAHSLNLSNVNFLGARSDIPEILSRSDIFVLTPTADTFPISIIEAMFGGQAVVTTNVGGIPEMVRDRETGLMVEPKNAGQLAEKLKLLIHDNQLRKTLGANAKKYAENHFTAEIMVKKIEAVYRTYS
jgi:glycosyltransferase involved in cell wall biosynthesis